MPLIQYLELMSEVTNPAKLLLRSNSTTIKYQDVDSSFLLLVKWLRFQFGKDWLTHVQQVFNWLTRKFFKRGGFEVVGEPNSGKTYMYGALTDLFMNHGFVRPNNGYTFNFDDCVGKQVIVCDEFSIEKSDQHSYETLKDCLAGSPATVKIKGKKPAVLQPMPWLFMTNNKEQFPKDKTADNPWLSRIYSVNVQKFPHWNDTTAEYRLNPYAWIILFKKLRFLN